MHTIFKHLQAFFLVVVPQMAFAAQAEHEKSIFFVLHRRSDYAPSWKELADSCKNNDVLVLIGNTESVSKMTSDEREVFAEVKIIDKFKFHHVQEFIETALARYYKKGDFTHVGAISEFDITLAAQLRDHFQSSHNMQGPGNAVMNNFRNKILMKSFLINTDIVVPRHQKFNKYLYELNDADYLQSLEDDLGYPMFIKPIDGAASIDTAYIKNSFSLARWCTGHAYTKQEYEIDEFVKGDLYHCDSVIQNGQIVHTFVSKYLHPNAEARNGKAIGSITLDPNSEDHQKLSEFAKRALRHFPSLPDGLTHLEVFKNAENRLVFLEVAARPAGAQVAEMYRVRTNGIDIRLLHLKLVFGLDVTKELQHLGNMNLWGPYAAMYQKINPSEERVIEKINNPTIESAHKTTWKCTAGDNVLPNNSISDTLFSIVLWNSDLDQLRTDLHRLDEQKIVVWKDLLIAKNTGEQPRLSDGVFNYVSHLAFDYFFGQCPAEQSFNLAAPTVFLPSTMGNASTFSTHNPSILNITPY